MNQPKQVCISPKTQPNTNMELKFFCFFTVHRTSTNQNSCWYHERI